MLLYLTQSIELCRRIRHRIGLAYSREAESIGEVKSARADLPKRCRVAHSSLNLEGAEWLQITLTNIPTSKQQH